MKKFINIKLIISLIVIFFCAVLVWYSPVFFKGYNSTTTASHVLVASRNYSLYGKYSVESKSNVILAPELIPTEGTQSYYGNKLGTILYAYVLKFFHLADAKSVVFVNSLILAFSLIFFGLTTYCLHGYKPFMYFSLIYIFLPSIWALPQMMIGYEFPLFFLSLFFLFFSLGAKSKDALPPNIKENKNLMKYFSRDKILLIFSGIFLAAACLSREALFLILPVLFIFLFFSRLKKLFLYIFIPVIIIFCVFWLPGFVSGQNTYLLFFTDKANEDLKSADFRYYAHLFPDPYTFHFDREYYVEKFNDTEKLDLLATLGREKVLTNMGYKSSGLINRIKIGTPLVFRHVFRLFSITEIGGPFIFFLLALGLVYLKRQKSLWFGFYVFWYLASVLMFAFINLANRNHLMDFAWAIATACALGLILLADVLSAYLYNNKYKNIIGALLLGIVIYNLVLTGHVMWGKEYDNSSVPLVTAYADKIKSLNLSSQDIIALFAGANDAYFLNFNTQKSFIVFNAETVKRLIKQDKLKEAFGTYKVSHILGYSPELSSEMARITGVTVIADNKIPVLQEESEMNNKNWFLNLVK